jgi:ferredoxin-thioredoxin reductase catalytic chain
MSQYLRLAFYFLALSSTAMAFVVMPSSSGSRCSPSTNISPVLYNKPEGMSDEEYEAKLEKATKAMTGFTNSYLKRTETTLCEDKSVPAAVIKGLAEHKVEFGAPLCPCRFYEDKEEEVKKGYWNCPCMPMRDEKICHCCLFLTEDSPFAGKDQVCQFETLFL